MTLEEARQLSEEAHTVGQELIGAKEAAKPAAAELMSLKAEILNTEGVRKGLRKQAALRKTYTHLQRVREKGVAFFEEQEQLIQDVYAAREEGCVCPDIGVWLEPGPTQFSKLASRNFDIYMEFLICKFDDAYAASLPDDAPAKKKLEAFRRGAGIAAPALRWG